MEVTHFEIKEANETIELILQKLVGNDEDIKAAEGSAINWVDYIFKANVTPCIFKSNIIK